jgi:hypothetical protein
MQVIVKSSGLISARAEKPMSDFSRYGIQPKRQGKYYFSFLATSFTLKS